ncbi:MAG: alpha/beta fold hydrolase [Candidatus Sumerlaeota bacterium]|nr:alpha/beta fold hydrolase [Candidatus Sumerlaeota bacterium]
MRILQFKTFISTLAVIFLFSCVSVKTIREVEAKEKRDPKTGVLTGAEPITLAPAPGHPETSGSACLLIHGFGASRNIFRDLGTQLANEGYAVRMMLLPGHGTSSLDWANPQSEDYVDCVRREYEHLRRKYARVYVIAHSFGGALTTLLAAEEPVDGIVLAAPYYGLTYKWWYVLPLEAWLQTAARMTPMLKNYISLCPLNDRSLAHEIIGYRFTSTAAVRQILTPAAMARNPETLRRITCPVLALFPRHDGVASVSAMLKAVKTMASPEKKILWLERSDHIVFYDYDREEAANAVIAFLRAR